MQITRSSIGGVDDSSPRGRLTCVPDRGLGGDSLRRLYGPLDKSQHCAGS
jgi:hypothetical protein